MPITPELLAIALQWGLKYGPGVAQEIVALFKKADPTWEDWHALFEKVKSYDSYVAPEAAPVV